MTPIDPRASRVLAATARANGGQAISLSETFWDVSGRCERPQRVTVTSRDYREFRYDPFWKIYTRAGWFRGEHWPTEVPDLGRSHDTHLEVRCGKCAPCRKARAFMWKERAKTECGRPETARTWFVTLTANAETQLRWSGEAAERLRQGGTVPSSLTPEEWYAERCKQAGRDLTLYVKRVRKNSGCQIRTLWVFERHAGGGQHDGLPHIHGLIHELRGTGSVKYRTLKSAWGHGYSTEKLLTDSSESDRSHVAAYVTKCCAYIAKETTVRIRASRYYGAPELPQQGSRADRIAAAAAGGGGVETFVGDNAKRGLTPQRDAGTHLRARGAGTAPGECKAPAVDGGAGGRGENPFPLLREAHRDRREPEGRQAREEGANPAAAPEGPTREGTAYATASRGR